MLETNVPVVCNDFSLSSSYHFPRSGFGLKSTRKRPVKAGDKLIYGMLAGLSPWNVNNEMRTLSLNIFTQVVTDECSRGKEAGRFLSNHRQWKPSHRLQFLTCSEDRRPTPRADTVTACLCARRCHLTNRNVLNPVTEEDALTVMFRAPHSP